MIVTSTNLSRDEAALRSSTIEVDHYDVQVDLRAAPQADPDTYPVDSEVVFSCASEATWLDFLDGTVERVVVNGTEVPVQYEGARILLDGLSTEASNTVRVMGRARYSRSGQGLHRFVDPVDQQTYLYTQYEPADSRRVFPNFEQPDLKAVFTFTVLAPTGWTVLSNQPLASGAPEPVEGGERHVFAPTKRQSTYLTAICAGPWFRSEGGDWVGTSGEPVRLGLLCRRSLAQYLDAEDFFQITRQGLDWYDANFGYPYPWGKYDQILVPEYNLGAMENPGCVTFTEHYIFRSTATQAQYQARANTILHEMAHMWFGDLVTPAWWDDLWLKESFAEFMGAHVSVAATRFSQAWVAFAGRRKSWAYGADQRPSTHPIVADITDLEAAAQNFDGITYAKGAAVLRQLVAHVGEDAFLAGARAYFAQHAFSSARLADLLAALEQTSGRDLGVWSRAWLQTAGPDTLTPVLEVAEGRITRLAIQQQSSDARTGEQVGRPHTLRVGLYALEGERLVRTELLDVELDGRAEHELAEAVGLAAPDLVLVNDTDLTYAKVRLDATSLATALAHLSKLDDPLARALLWSSLWNLCRDGELRVADYQAAVLAHGPAEQDSATLGERLATAWFALVNYVPDEHFDELSSRQAEGLRAGLRAAEAGSDTQLVWARAVAQAAVACPELVDLVGEQFDEATRVPGLELGSDLRWSMVQALAAQSLVDEARLADELALDPSSHGHVEALAAATMRPDAAVKAAAWKRVHEPRANSNEEVDALVSGLTADRQSQLLAPLRTQWFDGLLELWQQHSLEIAQRLVRGLYPRVPQADVATTAWLAAHPDAPGALRRLLIEGQDELRRALRAREFNG